MGRVALSCCLAATSLGHGFAVEVGLLSPEPLARANAGKRLHESWAVRLEMVRLRSSRSKLTPNRLMH